MCLDTSVIFIVTYLYWVKGHALLFVMALGNLCPCSIFQNFCHRQRGLLEENRVQMKRWNDPFHSLLNACASGEYGVPAGQEQAALLRQVRAHLREVLGLDGDDLRRWGGRLSCHFLLGQSASQGHSWWSYDFLRIPVIWCSEKYLIINFEPLKSRHKIQAVNGGNVFFWPNFV